MLDTTSEAVITLIMHEGNYDITSDPITTPEGQSTTIMASGEVVIRLGKGGPQDMVVLRGADDVLDGLVLECCEEDGFRGITKM